MKYIALDIAKYFVDKARADISKIEDMTLMKVMKLLYYADGCSLALDNGRLFSEKIVAWGHGPAIIEVYDFYPNAYNLDIIEDKDFVYKEIDEETKELLDVVYSMFGKPYTAWELREKTHREEPWIIASKNGTYFKDPEMIPEVRERYFKNTYLKRVA